MYACMCECAFHISDTFSISCKGAEGIEEEPEEGASSADEKGSEGIRRECKGR